MGAAPAGEAGEAWGYRRCRSRSAGCGSVPGTCSSVPSPTRRHRIPQLAFLRHAERRAAGRSSTPPLTPTATPTAVRSRTGSRPGSRRQGGGVLVGRDTDRPAGDRWSSSATTPAAAGGRSRSPPRRRTSCCRPKGKPRPRALAADQGEWRRRRRRLRRGRRHTGLIFGPQGRKVAAAIVLYDGDRMETRDDRSCRRPEPAASTSSPSPRPGSATPGRLPKPTTRR